MLIHSKPMNITGVTLVELILSMVIISISLTGILLTINTVTMNSVDPLLRQQAVYLAEAQMNEIMNLPFLEPSSQQPCPGIADKTHVCAYNVAPNNTITANDKWPAFGADLSNYSIAITVVPTTDLLSVPLGSALRITVAVSYGPTVTPIQLTAYRTNY